MTLLVVIVGVYVVVGLAVARITATQTMKSVEKERRPEHKGNSFGRGEMMEVKQVALIWGLAWPVLVVGLALYGLVMGVQFLVIPKDVNTKAAMMKKNEDDIAFLEGKLATAKAKVKKLAEEHGLPWPEDPSNEGK